MMKKVLSLLTILMLLLTVHAATADDSNSLKDDGFSTSYSYIFDYWEMSRCVRIRTGC